MITLEQEEKLIDRIKSLSELELTSLVEELREHIIREKLGHIFNEVSDESDLEEDNRELRRENEKLERKVEELEEDKSKLERTLDKIREIV